MVQNITVPLEWANVIPGVSGVEDVEFSIPTLEDIIDAVVENTLDRTQLDEALEEFVGDVVAEIQAAKIDTDQLLDDFIDELERRIDELLIDEEEIADLVVDRLNLEGLVTDQVDISGIFGPLTEDVVQAFEDVLNEVLGALDDLPEDLDSVIDAINQVIEDVDQLLERVPADFQQAVEDALEAVLEATGLDDFLDDPVAFLVEVIETALDQLTDETTAEEATTFREEFGP